MAKPVVLKFMGDSKDLERTFGKVNREADGTMRRVSDKFRSVGKSMMGTGRRLSRSLTLPIVGVGVAATKLASDLDESRNKARVVFGSMADDIERWSKSSARSVGLSQAKALEAAGTFGNLFTAMEVGQKPAANMSKELIQLSADLASFNNANPEDVLVALRSGLVGEVEPLRKFGVNVNAATVETKALEMGLADASGEISEGAKAQARYALIMEQTKTAQGDFANTSKGAANRTRILKAQFEDAGAKLGQKLLPHAIKLLGWVQKLVARFSNLSPKMQKWILILGGVAAAIGPVVTVLGALVTGIGLLLTPVGLVVGAIALVVAGFVLLYNKSETFRKFINNVLVPALKWLGRVFVAYIQTKLKMLAMAWSMFVSFGKGVIGVVKGLLDFFRPTFKAIGAVVTGVFRVIQGVWSVFAGVFTGDWRRVWRGIKLIFSGVWHAIVGVLRGVLGQIRNAVRVAWNAVGSFITRKLTELKERVRGWINGVRNLLGRLWQIGKDAVRGFIRGITSIDVGKALRKLFRGALDGVKKLLGISSPSKAFKDVGVNVALGLIEGVKSKARDVAGVLGGLFKGLLGGGKKEGSASVDANAITNAQRERLLAAGWRGDPRDKMERLYHPSHFADVAMAQGGTLRKASRVLVGEREPEILDLPARSTVTPLSKAAGVGGLSREDLDYLIAGLARVMARNRPVEVNLEARETVDPMLLGREIAWSLR